MFAARRGSIGGSTLFGAHTQLTAHSNPILRVYTGFQGDLGRCELMLTMFVIARVMLPLVVSTAMLTRYGIVC